MQDNNSNINLIKYMFSNYIIIILVLLIFSRFLILDDLYINQFLYVFISNSIWVLWIVKIFLYPLFVWYNYDYYIILINILILFIIYYFSFKYNKKNIGYIVTVFYLFTSLLIWYFIQIISMQ